MHVNISDLTLALVSNMTQICWSTSDIGNKFGSCERRYFLKDGTFWKTVHSGSQITLMMVGNALIFLPKMDL